MTYSLPGVDIQNIYAYRAQQTLYEQGYGEPFVGSLPIVRVRKDYQYDEIRATSTDDSPLHWIVGATYLVDFFHGNTDILVLPPLFELVNRVNQWRHDWSVYGDATYDLTSKLSIEGSLRYIRETNDTTFLVAPGVPLSSSATGVGSRLIPSGT